MLFTIVMDLSTCTSEKYSQSVVYDNYRLMSSENKAGCFLFKPIDSSQFFDETEMYRKEKERPCGSNEN